MAAVMAAERVCPISSAGSKVGAIVELVEMILLEVPPKTVLTSQRVSRTWKATIDDSRKLRRQLFMSSIGDKSDVINTADSSPPNEALKKILEVRRSLDEMPIKTWCDFKVSHLCAVNPFLLDLVTLCIERKAPPVSFQFNTGNQSFCSIGSASWKQMYLSRPPTTTVRIYATEADCTRDLARLGLDMLSNPFRYSEEITKRFISVKKRARAAMTDIKIVNRNGVTLGDVIERLSELQKRHQQLLEEWNNLLKRLQTPTEDAFLESKEPLSFWLGFKSSRTWITWSDLVFKRIDSGNGKEIEFRFALEDTA